MSEKNLVGLLERVTQLIERLKLANMDEMVSAIEELNAMNPQIKGHINTLNKFQASTFGDEYVYNKDNAKLEKA